MTSSEQKTNFIDKWEAERALALAEAEAYERERAIAGIRLLMRRFGITQADVGAIAGSDATFEPSFRSSPIEQD